MSNFNTSAWAFHGDRTPRERLLRVFDHYGTEYWSVDNSIRFVTSDDNLIKDVDRAVGGSAVERVRACGDKVRYRVNV